MTLRVAVEAATAAGSVAIARGPELLGEVVLGVAERHAAGLLPALDFLLARVGETRTSITQVLVGAGPGSFTGVRVAAALARSLSAGLDVPLCAYPSLAVQAVSAGARGLVCPMFDARRGEVYWALYHLGGSVDEVRPPAASSVDTVLSMLSNEAVTFAGDGARRYAGELGIETPRDIPPRASALFHLADVAAETGDGVSGRWEPTYLRASGAERGVAG